VLGAAVTNLGPTLAVNKDLLVVGWRVTGTRPAGAAVTGSWLDTS
jgi:hypothetical protein